MAKVIDFTVNKQGGNESPCGLGSVCSTHPSALLLVCPPSLRYIEKSITPTCRSNLTRNRKSMTTETTLPLG